MGPIIFRTGMDMLIADITSGHFIRFVALAVLSAHLGVLAMFIVIKVAGEGKFTRQFSAIAALIVGILAITASYAVPGIGYALAVYFIHSSAKSAGEVWKQSYLDPGSDHYLYRLPVGFFGLAVPTIVSVLAFGWDFGLAAFAIAAFTFHRRGKLNPRQEITVTNRRKSEAKA